MRISLPIHSYQHRSIPASTAKLVNCYPETLPPTAKSPVALSRFPGIVSAGTVGNGPIHGMHYALDYLFVVSGSNLYKVDSSHTATLVGSIGSATNISIDMDHNTENVVVVNNPDAYYYDLTTFAQISDADFTALGASDVEFLDNYLLFVEPGSAVFYCADLGSATSFDALNFATAEGAPDDLVGFKVDHRQALLLGTHSGEIWENTGASGFPFERAINGYFEIGCLNGRTIQKADNTIFWLADDYTVRRLEGVTPMRISTFAVEEQLRSVTISSGRATVIKHKGHIWYVLGFTEKTFAFDLTVGEWFDLESYGFDCWNWRVSTQAFNREYVGSSVDNKIGYIDSDTYDYCGDTQIMEWTYQPVYAEGRLASHKRLEMILEVGVGQATGVTNPQIMLQFSDDGGRTWTSLPQRSIGRMGEYQHRVIWHRLGSSTQRVYRASVSDAVKVVVTDTLLEVEGGRV